MFVWQSRLSDTQLDPVRCIETYWDVLRRIDTCEMICCLAACCLCLSRISPASTSDGTTSRSRKNSERSRAISANELWKPHIRVVSLPPLSCLLLFSCFEPPSNRKTADTADPRNSHKLALLSWIWKTQSYSRVRSIYCHPHTGASSFLAQNQIFLVHLMFCIIRKTLFFCSRFPVLHKDAAASGLSLKTEIEGEESGTIILTFHSV